MYKKIVWISFIFSVFTVIAFADRVELYMYSNVSFVLTIALMLIYVLKINPKVLKGTFIFIPFVIYSFLSFIWSYDKNATIIRSFTMTKLLIFSLALTWYIIITKELEKYIEGIMYAGIGICIYFVNLYGLSNIKMLINKNSRIGGDIVNQNSLAMFLAITVLIMFWKYMRSKKWIYIIMMTPIITIIGMTGSKKGVIDILLGIIIIFIVMQNRKVSYKKIFNILLGFVIGCAIIGVLWNLQSFSVVRNRFETMFEFLNNNSSIIDYSTNERKIMIEEGIKQFFKTPICGIGISATGVITEEAVGYNSYLHNNYIELLASGGIIGFILFYAPIIYIIKKVWSKRNYYYEEKIIFVLLIVHLVNDFASVGYFSRINFVIFSLGLATCYLHEDNKGSHENKIIIKGVNNS